MSYLLENPQKAFD